MSIFKQIFGKKTAHESFNTLTNKQVDELYKRPEPFANHLPVVEFGSKHKLFLLEDGISVAAMLEVTAISTEAKNEKFFKDTEDNIRIFLSCIPEEDNPWIVQSYTQDDNSFTDVIKGVEAYIPEHIRNTEYTQNYLKDFAAHYRRVCNPKGYFLDEAVSGTPWFGKIRRTRLFIYRRQRNQAPEHNPVEELNEMLDRLKSQARSAGITLRQCGGIDYYTWLLRWFNPNSELAGEDLDKLVEMVPYPGDEEMPIGLDFSAMLLLKQPETKNDCLVFDNHLHKAITIDTLKRIPDIGHLTAERRIGDKLLAPFDQLPSNTIFIMTIVIKPQDDILNHVKKIENSAKGGGAEAELAESDAKRASELMAHGDKLYPTVMTVLVKGKNPSDLRIKINDTNAILHSQGFHPVAERNQQLSINTYIRHLPMNYEHHRDKAARLERLMFVSHLARIIPFYGRSRGTGNPGLPFFNRGAEPLFVDPLNKEDRTNNAFGFFVGPPGSGKSASLVTKVRHMMAVYRPRLFIIEKGGSFKLLGEHFRELGLTVHTIKVTPQSDVSLPPFADAFKMLAIEEENRKSEELDYKDPFEEMDKEIEAFQDADDDSEQPDYLGEMELAARVMITGGDLKEEERMTRADRMIIRNAIIDASKRKWEALKQLEREGKKPTPVQQQVLTEDVANELLIRSRDPETSEKLRERAEDMSNAIQIFCTGMAGRFFNRPGENWPEADVTIFEVGTLAKEDYQDQLTVAYMSLMNKINTIVEREEYSERQTLIITDEAHLITTNPLLAPYIVKIVKMWRKLGAWKWLATQNMGDFPNAAKKLLAMFEWWIAMVCPKQEIDEIARFKQLTEEERTMLLAATKESGKYTEGVILSDTVKSLFRNVPPPISLALAMTEKHEKKERADIMKAEGISELHAAYRVADKIAQRIERNIEEGVA
ncbi:conjugative transfer ATPase [Endozoicomonas sp. SM1973]|uniref:Conjugative transfer ATPase n=1 Tax=Spartinivicinus marinus TaxID=2994442 RepID=A0A853I542_9GAMM|nr:conjugative transfer ATPase [Spartinivicinus marinus]MCX4030176.1 conjugative transfer ATPase [Spartinivicinus marinus]NYZ67819.1 conjugative transfer ATPase [Spartinivicinus marinus]